MQATSEAFLMIYSHPEETQTLFIRNGDIESTPLEIFDTLSQIWLIHEIVPTISVSLKPGFAPLEMTFEDIEPESQLDKDVRAFVTAKLTN
ncbi:MAG: hypothetical protein MRY21_00210 [Simkaniaceae bacterium]|nr:hypothetical protein [Simkaniaceae bacterium]